MENRLYQQNWVDKRTGVDWTTWRGEFHQKLLRCVLIASLLCMARHCWCCWNVADFVIWFTAFERYASGLWSVRYTAITLKPDGGCTLYAMMDVVVESVWIGSWAVMVMMWHGDECIYNANVRTEVMKKSTCLICCSSSLKSRVLINTFHLQIC